MEELKLRIYLLVRQTTFKVWLEWHKLVCRFWNWRLPQDLNKSIEAWKRIDHRKDKSWSGKDFRFWYYNRKIS